MSQAVVWEKCYHFRVLGVLPLRFGFGILTMLQSQGMPFKSNLESVDHVHATNKTAGPI